MQGLELCRHYFFSHGLPLLEERFSHLMGGMAAGLAGDGSDCFGFDDSISRDHDWGPGFCLWLSREQHDVHGPLLAAALDGFPPVHLGFGPRVTSSWGQGRVGVMATEDFYQTFTGLDHPPQTLDEWLAIPESALAAATNGQVFLDRCGIFSSWREHLLGFYPEDVRLKKIASRCMTMGQSGQYNFSRCVRRGDVFGAQYCLVKFAIDALSLVFLLNRKYAPYFKWVHRAAQALPVLGRVVSQDIARLMGLSDADQQLEIIEQISSMILGELLGQGLTHGPGSFLCDHGPRVQQRIRDGNMASRNVWVG